MSDKILLDAGSGGRASQRLVAEIFLTHLKGQDALQLNDAALIQVSGPLAVSTDSFTVDPIFFPGGDIGSLAVHGTVNDVAMLGAEPKYLTCGFIIEEGLPVADLERIVASMGKAAEHAGVVVVTGDTKVVPKGAADKIFINTTGIGEVVAKTPPAGERAKPGDAVLLSGTMGDHGLTILATREGLTLGGDVQSDSAALNHLILKLVREVGDIHVLRDPTRGGLATTLNEIAQSSKVGMELMETDVPVRAEVTGGCKVLGLDPLYLANEGKFICILPQELAGKALEIMKADPLGADACQVGTITEDNAGKVVLVTQLGGKRLLGMLEGEQLPRIC